MSFTAEDVEDVEFADATELKSDGSSVYKTVSVSSTSSTGNTIVITTTPPLNLDGFVYGDDPVEPGETITLTGTTVADGTYTIDTVVDNNTISVLEAVANSTGGSGSVSRPPGARLIGVNPSSLSHVTSFDVQSALIELDAAIGTGGGLNISDEGTLVANTPHTTINFVGAGVTAVDGGLGVVDVTIPGGGGNLHDAVFDVTFPKGYDEVTGTVTGLSPSPTKVVPGEPIEIGPTVWNGVRWALAVVRLNPDGFDWALRILDEAAWPGPGSTIVRVPYLWSDT